MELGIINEALKDLSFYALKQKFDLVETSQPQDYWSEKSEGNESRKVEIYSIDKEQGIYLRVERSTDSYGDNETLVGISFVKPKEVTKTVFEPID
jgi:hypothetical protein